MMQARVYGVSFFLEYVEQRNHLEMLSVQKCLAEGGTYRRIESSSVMLTCGGRYGADGSRLTES